MESRTADWRRLGDLVEQRRRELGLTQQDVRQRGGPSTATMRLIEGALQDSYRPAIMARLERALGWKSGSVDAILDGGEPTVEQVPSGPVGLGGNARLHAVGEVVDVPGDAPGDDADIHLVMDSDLPEDEKHRIVRELLQERADERRRRVERARRYVDLYRRAQGE